MLKSKRAWWIIGGSVIVLLVWWLLLSVWPVASDGFGAAQSLPGDTCQTYNGTGLPVAIPDSWYITNTVSSIPVAQTGYITGITVTVTISHTFSADLAFSLCGGDRMACLLSRGDGTGQDGIWTFVWSDTGTEELYGPPFVGPYLAEEPLATLLGKKAAGWWRLLVRDEYSGDTGSLNAWSLEICTTQATPTLTPSPTYYDPLATWTPLYDCTDDYFVAKNNDDPCNCSAPTFDLVPDSDSYSGLPWTGNEYYRICYPGCYSLNAHFSARMVNQANRLTLFGGGVSCEIVPLTGSSESSGNSCIAGDCLGLGCKTAICEAHSDVDIVDNGSFPGWLFVLNSGNFSTCSLAAPYTQWEYDVDFGECVPRGPPTPTPGVTRTPTPTITPACTARPGGPNWWIW